MPKYKVGDIAALFPKPKVATTEGGKKLQSLFSEFHSKGNKIMSQGQTQKKKFQPENEDFKKVTDSEPQSLQATKGKKRNNIFSGVESNIKKVTKKIKLDVDEPKPAEVYKAPGNWKTNSLSDVNFPRSKKKFNQRFNSNFDSSVTEDSPTKQSNEFNFKSHGPQKVKKFNQQFNSNVDKVVTEDSPTKRSNKINFKSHGPQKVKKFNQQFNSNFNSNVNEDSPTKRSNEFNFKSHGPQKVKKFNQRFNSNFNSGVNEVSPTKRSNEFNFKSHGPQKVKKFNQRFNSNFNSAETEDSTTKRSNEFNFKPSGPQKVKGFIKRAKHDVEKGTIGNFQIPDQEFPQPPKYEVSDNNSLSKSKNVKQRVRKPKKKKLKNAAVQEIPAASDFTRVPGVKNKDPNQPDFIRVPGIKKKDPNQPDFIKVPDTKTVDEKEVLSRTLFVGNLPTNTSRKALAKLFTAFGPVEHVRYNSIETDRNKIFKNGGAKLTHFNYAATSVPGFIVFKERENAANALALNGSVFENHHITVDFALPAGARKEYDKNRSIFIGNLPFGVKDEEIWDAFAECGRVEAVRVIRDPMTGIGKGFGYVLFTTVRSRENALELKDVEFEGRPIRIKAAEINKKVQKRSDKAPVDINTKRDTLKIVRQTINFQWDTDINPKIVEERVQYDEGEYRDMDEMETDKENKSIGEEEEVDEEEIPEDEGELMNKCYIEDSSGMDDTLRCRGVRIGSLQVYPKSKNPSLHVLLASDGMSFDAPMVTDQKKMVNIVLKPSDIIQMLVHFGRCLPIVFIFTTPSFAVSLRKALNMLPGDCAYFDPSSNDQRQRKITFIIDSINEDQRRFLRSMFLNHKKVQELDQKTANEILVQSSPDQTIRPGENALELKDGKFEGRPIRIKAVEISKKTRKRLGKSPVDKKY